MKKEKIIDCDCIVIGAGAAGLMAALTLAPRKVAVLNAGTPASGWSQGGIAAAVGPNDSPARHMADTLKAGAGLSDVQAAQLLTQEAPAAIGALEKLGVRFARDGGDFLLNREACHGERRVLRAKAGDGFGQELMRALATAAVETSSIRIFHETAAVQLLKTRSGRVVGVEALHKDASARTIFRAPAVLLATGGIGGLFATTTNPLSATGAGLALAARAGAVLADLEFVQFHPTALDIGIDPAPLATEALRGEGAILINGRGERFMPSYHRDGELAPRDEVSRGIFNEMRKGNNVFLDCRALDLAHFPALAAACARKHLDPRRLPVPVRPAVHYHMGGVATDLDGRTNLEGLWAAGEVAATGLHGANRLASNSLLEAVVMGMRAAVSMRAAIRRGRSEEGLVSECVIPSSAASAMDAMDEKEKAAVISRMRKMADTHLGVVRDARTLRAAVTFLAETETVFADVADIANRALVLRLIAEMALAREESRGGHFRSDFPAPDPRQQQRRFITHPDSAAAPAPESRKEKKTFSMFEGSAA